MADLEKSPASPPSAASTLQAQHLPKRRQNDFTDMAICASPGGGSYESSKKQSRRRRKQDLSVWHTLRTSIVHHQIGISINLLLLLAFTHIFLPAARQTTTKFFTLQYASPPSSYSQTTANQTFFTRGPSDIYYVLTWIVIFTGLRELTMSYVLKPFASLAGVRKPKQQTRFVEQAWLLVYYIVFWTWGMYIYATSEYWLDLPKLWADFPVREMTGWFKSYYLIQFAFWVQQIVVVNIEERRKDHWQMFTHHIVTCLLLLSSYGYYQTRVGNVILVLMDVVDLVFPAAKMLKYAGWQKACDAAFGLFILSWFLARHVAYLTVCWSIAYDSYRVMTFGCYSSVTGEMTSVTPPANDRFVLGGGPNGTTPEGGTQIWTNLVQPYFNPGATVCYNHRMQYVFLSLLLFLQGITVMWFMMILRVAYRVLQGQGADDSRSDDEGEEEISEFEASDDELDVTDVVPEKPSKPVEQIVDAGGLNMNIKRKSSPLSARFVGKNSGQGSSTGIGSYKEVLNRIGCEKPVE